MRILLLTATNRQPAWIVDGYEDYARRLRGRCTLELIEIPLAKRTAGTPPARAVEQEGERMLAAVPAAAHVVALSERGTAWSTPELAARLDEWTAIGAPVCLLVGGPDGLSPACSARAAEHWSLSRLTLPHGLVRVVAAEALYRAWSVLEGHPYHRA
ncbi:MAG: 23S rRNA (pseudouridine(1915)-N(3))-methyltransferase RlmH [Gammaproteobacteria bacterium]|nr:23S rRNA (pseudouridine(1915)-N(3))-methyltransferase RlmH [Gammaproteobacteria bacterium]